MVEPVLVGSKMSQVLKVFELKMLHTLKKSCLPIEIDECTSTPCIHGECNNELNMYSCTCDDGYDGDTCENGIYKHILYIIININCIIIK